MAFKVPNIYRIKVGILKSTDEDGNNGAFEMQTPYDRYPVWCVASDGKGWEHVSVSCRKKIPSWELMAYVQGIFWSDQDCVVQYHPPKSEYVNNCENCLHLWRPIWDELPRPPKWMVGV